MNKKDTNRLIWVDVLNICACIGVLILHTNSTTIHSFNGIIDYTFIWGVFTHTCFYWPVPVFLMLSGSNLIARRGGYKLYAKRRFNKTVVPFLVWSFLYVVAFNAKHINDMFSLKTLQDVINGMVGAGYMWFFIPLFAFYLSAPFLSILIEHSSVTERRFFLLFCFIFVSLIPFVASLLRVDGFKYNLFPMGTSFLIYPVLGWMINNDEWFVNHKKLIYVVGLCSMLIHFIGLYVTVGLLGWSSKIFQNTLYPTDFFMASAVFLLFRNYNWQKLLNKCRISTDVLIHVSSCSLGVYLIQNLLFVVSSFNLNLLNNHYFGFILTYITALLIVIVMKRLPVLNRIVP